MSVSNQSRVSGRRGRPFYGWWVVAVASMQGMFGNGAISSGFPIFFEPIRQTLGIGYAQMSLVFSLARAEGGMGSPAVGWLAPATPTTTTARSRFSTASMAVGVCMGRLTYVSDGVQREEAVLEYGLP
ncbi:MAG TPA: hypothetical protein EYO17_15250 [Dehalococcoidia bacterium]|nr:hypothetical protein [Dehalococcoidia bacterium]